MSVLKAALGLVALPMQQIEHRFPDQVDTKVLLDYAFKVLVMVMAAVLGFMVSAMTRIDNRLDSIDTRLTRIEASRFTSNDGLVLYERLNEKADRSEVPPVWFLRQVEALEARMDRLEGR